MKEERLVTDGMVFCPHENGDVTVIECASCIFGGGLVVRDKIYLLCSITDLQTENPQGKEIR